MSDTTGSLHNFLRKFIPFALLIAGIILVPLKVMHTDLSRIPGDNGDARFNNYILEHGYQYLSGTTTEFWSSPTMYPFQNVIAMSDNLLGTLPVYAVFRFGGFDRETAFQFWILAVFVLNFVCCYYALNKWTRNSVVAATGAYIFAFGVFNIPQLMHLQVFPRFISPLVLLWTWQYLTTKKSGYFALAALGIVYQFYCALYLGFFLVFILFFFILGYLIVYRDLRIFTQFKSIRTIAAHLSIAAISLMVLWPLFKPYVEITDVVGLRSFNAAYASLPRFRSYFFSAPSSVPWGKILYEHSSYRFDEWWNHFLFVGALPWLAILLLPWLMLRKQSTPGFRMKAGWLIVSLLLAFGSSLRTQDFTLYRYIFEIPGFASMRSVDRVINIESILFILVFCVVFKELISRSSKSRLLLYAIPLLVVIDNLAIPEPHRSISKAEVKGKVDSTRELIRTKYQTSYKAISFMPVQYKSNSGGMDLPELHLNVMLACQELNIPCVNGYSGFNPYNFSDYYNKLDRNSLINWLACNEADYKAVQSINLLPSREISRKYIQLKASNGKYLSCDEGNGNRITCDKDAADLWETFLLVEMENHTWVLLTHTGKFIMADAGTGGKMVATASRPSDWEVFEPLMISENSVAIKASNGKFVSCDLEQLTMAADADEITPESTFTFIRK